MKINWKQYWYDSMLWKKSKYPKLKCKALLTMFHVIRLFFRVKFSKRWRKEIQQYRPQWVKGKVK